MRFWQRKKSPALSPDLKPAASEMWKKDWSHAPWFLDESNAGARALPMPREARERAALALARVYTEEVCARIAGDPIQGYGMIISLHVDFMPLQVMPLLELGLDLHDAAPWGESLLTDFERDAADVHVPLVYPICLRSEGPSEEEERFMAVVGGTRYRNAIRCRPAQEGEAGHKLRKERPVSTSVSIGSVSLPSKPGATTSMQFFFDGRPPEVKTND